MVGDDGERQDQEEKEEPELGIGGTVLALVFIFGIVYVLGSAMNPTKVMTYSERGTSTGAAFDGDKYNIYKSVAGCRIDGELGVQTRDGGCTSMLEVKDRVIESGRESVRQSDTADRGSGDGREVMQEFNVDREGAKFIAHWFQEKGYITQSCGELFGRCEYTSKLWIEVYQGLPENYADSEKLVGKTEAGDSD